MQQIKKKHWITYIEFVRNDASFYIVLFINLVLLSVTKFYPSMDGPTHLYNSNLLLNLLSGNEFINKFYSINSVAIPNWTSHVMLALFNIIVPGWLAEKFLLYIYITGMAFSFRYFLRQSNPNNSYLSILIFPFSYTFLFHLGFYNFSLSFIFMFLALGYYIKNVRTLSVGIYCTLTILLLLCYYSNILVFGFLGLSLGTFLLQIAIEFYNKDKDVSKTLRFLLRRMLFLFITSLPALTLGLVFLLQTKFFPTNQKYAIQEIMKWITDVRPLIVYAYDSDKTLTAPFFSILFILSFLIITKEIKRKENNNINTYFLLLPLFLSLALLFLVPDGAGAGMMTNRLITVVFMFALLFIGSMAKNIKLNSIIMIVIVILHIGLLFKHLNGTIKKLDKHAQTLYETSDKILSNSIVLPVNFSEHWIELHPSNYLGADKPLVILENYEASVGWFPVKWDAKERPQITLSGKTELNKIKWPTNTNSKNKKEIDYVIILGNIEMLKLGEWSDLKTILSDDFKLIYESKDKYAYLYKKL